MDTLSWSFTSTDADPSPPSGCSVALSSSMMIRSTFRTTSRRSGNLRVLTTRTPGPRYDGNPSTLFAARAPGTLGTRSASSEPGPCCTAKSTRSTMIWCFRARAVVGWQLTMGCQVNLSSFCRPEPLILTCSQKKASSSLSLARALAWQIANVGRPFASTEQKTHAVARVTKCSSSISDSPRVLQSLSIALFGPLVISFVAVNSKHERRDASGQTTLLSVLTMADGVFTSFYSRR
jgi:hypothetical protein